MTLPLPPVVLLAGVQRVPDRFEVVGNRLTAAVGAVVQDGVLPGDLWKVQIEAVEHVKEERLQRRRVEERLAVLAWLDVAVDVGVG